MTLIIGFLFFCTSLFAGYVDPYKPYFREWASPVLESPANLSLATGSALTISYFFFQRDTSDEIQNYAQREKPLGDYSKIGEIAGYAIPNALYAGWWYWDHHKTANKYSKKKSLVMFKSTLYSSLTTNILKHTIRETRPAGREVDSFPSGHATSAFAFASVIAQEHGWYWGIPSYLLAGFIAYSRLNDGRHFTHDILAGATIGTAYGLAMSKLENQKSDEFQSYGLLPLMDSRSIGVLFAKNFY